MFGSWSDQDLRAAIRRGTRGTARPMERGYAEAAQEELAHRERLMRVARDAQRAEEARAEEARAEAAQARIEAAMAAEYPFAAMDALFEEQEAAMAALIERLNNGSY